MNRPSGSGSSKWRVKRQWQALIDLYLPLPLTLQNWPPPHFPSVRGSVIIYNRTNGDAVPAADAAARSIHTRTKISIRNRGTFCGSWTHNHFFNSLISSYWAIMSLLVYLRLHPAGTLNDSDKCDSIKSFWNWYFNGGLWEIVFLVFQVFQRIKEMLGYREIRTTLRLCLATDFLNSSKHLKN